MTPNPPVVTRTLESLRSWLLWNDPNSPLPPSLEAALLHYRQQDIRLFTSAELTILLSRWNEAPGFDFYLTINPDNLAELIVLADCEEEGEEAAVQLSIGELAMLLGEVYTAAFEAAVPFPLVTAEQLSSVVLHLNRDDIPSL